MGVEARVVQQRRGARQPGGDEHVAGRLRPAAGGRAPHQLAGRRREPAACLQALAEQVALGVHDRLGLAGGAARERDQGRLLGASSAGGAGSAANRRPRRGSAAPAPPARPARARPRLRSSATIRRGLRHLDPQPQVLGAQLLGARAAPPRRCESRRASPAPTRGGCRSASSPPRRGRRRGVRTCAGQAAQRARRARRSSTRAGTPRARARPARGASGGAPSTISRVKFTPVFSSQPAPKRPRSPTQTWP